MQDLVCTIPVPKTVQELEQAIELYKAKNLSGAELFCHWQAIRQSALDLQPPEPNHDRVSGEDSY